MQSIPSPLLGHTALHPALRSALPAALFATSLATHALTLNADFSAAILLPVCVYILCESSTLLLAPLPRLHGLLTGSALARRTAAPTSPAVATADFASSSCSTSAALATAAAATAAGTVHGSRLVADHLPLHRRACEER